MSDLKLAAKVVFYLYPIVALIGLMFNAFAFVIFSSRKRFQHTFFWIYFRFLIIFDCLSQFLPVNRFLELALDISIENISNFLCKFRYYYIYSVYPVSGWTLAIVSIDRFLSISFPNRFNIRKKCSFQICVCVFIMLFNFIYFSPVLFYYYLDEFNDFNNETNQTFINVRCENHGIPLNIMDLIGSTLIPFSIMILFTLFTLISLYKTRKKSLTSHQQKKSRSKDNRFAFVTITISFVFLIVNIPYGIFANVESLFVATDLTNLIYSFCLLLIYVNSSLTFFINIVVNSLFRKELKEILIKKNAC